MRAGRPTSNQTLNISQRQKGKIVHRKNMQDMTHCNNTLAPTRSIPSAGGGEHKLEIHASMQTHAIMWHLNKHNDTVSCKKRKKDGYTEVVTSSPPCSHRQTRTISLNTQLEPLSVYSVPRRTHLLMDKSQSNAANLMPTIMTAETPTILRSPKQLRSPNRRITLHLHSP